MNYFYPTESLSIKDKKTLLHRAKNLSYVWWIDKLDCLESIHRQKIDMPFDDMLAKLDESCHFVIIYRDGEYEGKPYLELGFSTMRHNPTYYLFIKCDISNRLKILEGFTELLYAFED